MGLSHMKTVLLDCYSAYNMDKVEMHEIALGINVPSLNTHSSN